MRHIVHPGTVASARTATALGRAEPLRFVLEPGKTVDQAIAEGFEASGCLGGFVAFEGGECDPFRFVIPAASPDEQHVAWYSRTFEPSGRVDITRACAIVGLRDEKPFVHCHGIWTTAEGQQMGHLLASETVVAEPIVVTGIGVREAMFKAVPDAETNFTLFEPTTLHDCGTPAAPVLLAKVRPNEDITLAVEKICMTSGIERANVYGIGSLNEVRFADGTSVSSHATEVLIRRGLVETRDGQQRALFDIDVVDMTGRIQSGELVRGDNPVCVTFELVIEPIDR